MTAPIGVAIFISIWFTVLLRCCHSGCARNTKRANISRAPIPGAPVAPRLLIKAIWTTGITLVVFAGLWIFMIYEA